MLAVLEASGVALPTILQQAEREGMTPGDLVGWTEDFLGRECGVDGPDEALLLVFGSVRNWWPLLPQVRQNCLKVIKDFVTYSPINPGALHSLGGFLLVPDQHFPFEFRTRVLRRLGYPRFLIRNPWPKDLKLKQIREVETWLETGQPLATYRLHLQSHCAESRQWGDIHAPELSLRNGHGPEHLSWHADPFDPNQWHLKPSLHIEGVSGLRCLLGIMHGKVALKACPDLASIPDPCNDLEVEDCPKITHVHLGPHSRHLVIKRCHDLESITPGVGSTDSRDQEPNEQVCELETLNLDDCRRLCTLPQKLWIRKQFRLRNVGPVKHWPQDLQVRGDFLIADCPRIDRLPLLKVQGSLIVSGNSGLRGLSPGTVIGGHLDLRGCPLLEDIPRGVKVGGMLYLPQHLSRRRNPRPTVPERPEAPPRQLEPDLYEDLRILLIGLKFPALSNVEDRPLAIACAEKMQRELQLRLGQEPGYENLVLWTASEVWRELNEQTWAAWNPWLSQRDGSEDVFPQEWFLELVQWKD